MDLNRSITANGITIAPNSKSAAAKDAMKQFVTFLRNLCFVQIATSTSKLPPIVMAIITINPRNVIVSTMELLLEKRKSYWANYIE
uniref:Uncharacterized protein n=1 Tax=Schistosoma haematobium TaxID=6185 RepID=A0A095A5Z0_SCHHA